MAMQCDDVALIVILPFSVLGAHYINLGVLRSWIYLHFFLPNEGWE